MSRGDVRITRHAAQRAQERVGIPFDRARRLAGQALSHGTSPEDAKPRLRRALERKLAASAEQHPGRRVFIRAFKGFCFLFAAGGVLLMVFPLRRKKP